VASPVAPEPIDLVSQILSRTRQRIRARENLDPLALVALEALANPTILIDEETLTNSLTQTPPSIDEDHRA
jgi:hypothetical protein